ncbi:MAG: ferrochelatase [Nitrospirae bacterium]|nr:ferrochelatase [Nitrospirota bacterium]
MNKDIIGVVLLNLGGPDSLQAVRPFLYNLFSDRDIIRLGPSLLQKPVAWLISGLRSNKSEAMYSLIGGKSPILDITTAQAEALERELNKGSGVNFKVYIGMRYWHPFIKDTIRKIVDDGIRQLIVLSLYPHYSKATTGSSISEFKREIEKFTIQDSRFKIQYIEQWYDFPPYIEALAELILEGISEFKGEDFELLYSAHSLPSSFIDKGDPYLDHIKATITAVNSLLTTHYSSLINWHLSFQSKTGPVKWLEPTTEKALENLSGSGCKNLLVVPISFVSDHIETLYEIDILYKKIAGSHGINLKRCEALNTSDKFILAMKELVLANMHTLSAD